MIRGVLKPTPLIKSMRSRAIYGADLESENVKAEYRNSFGAARLSVRQLGVAALAVSLSLVVVGVAIYGGEMWPHLIAEAVGIFGETALVVLVLDRMSSSEGRREWRFVSTAAGHRMAACVTDVMRLCCVRWSPTAYEANIERYAEFTRIAKLHLEDLRNILTALALSSEPHGYERARRIELRLAWLVNYLGDVPGKPENPGPEYPIVVGTVKSVAEFLQFVASPEFLSDASAADCIVARLGGPKNPASSSSDAQEFVSLRLAAQDELLRMKADGDAPVRGIFYDIDQELAHGYFAIDYTLLSILGGSSENTAD
jgi:hypothetical protein